MAARRKKANLELFPKSRGSSKVLDSGCTRCPHLATTRTRISWGHGNLRSPVLFIGEAPAAGNPAHTPWSGSNHTGIPFTSRTSGRTFRQLITDAGFDLARDFYVTNTVKCFPPSARDPSKPRKPSRQELETCWAHLDRELELVQPALVACVGAVAWKQLHRQMGLRAPPFLKSVLRPRSIQGRRLVALLHPARFGAFLAKVGMTRERYVTRLGRLL